METAELLRVEEFKASEWSTVMISGGRRDKISKGDVVGFCIKQGGLNSEDLGLIELQQNNSFVAVKTKMVSQLIEEIDRTKLKTKKILATEV